MHEIPFLNHPALQPTNLYPPPARPSRCIDNLPINKTSLVGGEETNHVGDIARLTHAPDGYPPGRVLHRHLRINAHAPSCGACHLRINKTGSDSVDGNAKLAQFDSQCAREALHTGFD